MLRVVITLFLVLTFITGAATFWGVQTMPADAACAYYTSGLRDQGWIDLRTGQSVKPAPPLDTLDRAYYSTFYSPDHKNVAFLLFLSDSWGENVQLMIKPSEMPSRKATLIEQNIGLSQSDERDYQWSPDSQWLAYHWQMPDGAHHLSIVDASGRNKRTVMIDAQPDDQVSLFGWSADGQYLATSVEPDIDAPSDGPHMPRNVTLWSAHDLKPLRVWSMPNLVKGRGFGGGDAYRYPPDMMDWSPTANRFVFFTTNQDAQTLTLWLGSPEADHDFSFTIPYIYGEYPDSYIVDFRWSPDGQHVALLTLPQLDYSNRLTDWRLDIFGVDGSVFYQVTDTSTNAMTIAGGGLVEPLVYWSENSESLFFVKDPPRINPQTSYNLDHGDLYIYPIGKTPQLVQANIYMNPGITVDRKYIVMEIQENGKDYITAMDLVDLSLHKVIEDTSRVGMRQVLVTSSDQASTFIFSVGGTPIAIANFETGMTINLMDRYWQDWKSLDEVKTSLDRGYVGSRGVDGRFFRITDAKTGHTYQFALSRLMLSEIGGFSVSPDDKVIAFVNNPWNSGTKLDFYTLEGALLRHYDNLLIDNNSLRFGACPNAIGQAHQDTVSYAADPLTRHGE